MDWTKEFEEFLIKNDCFSELLNYLFDHNISFIDYVKSVYAPSILLVAAIPWNKWDDKWARLHSQWCDYISLIKELHD